VLVVDTTILCVWLCVPGRETCGPENDHWDYARVTGVINGAVAAGSTLVLPLATLIETGNHIANGSDRFKKAQDLAKVIRLTADAKAPWAAFTDQGVLWERDALRRLAERWPALAAEKLSIGDATIADVAEYYARMGYAVEILTGDKGLQAHQPAAPLQKPRRKS
jgi:hypothetical protein